MGAESYILRRVRDEATARKFLAIIDAFKARLAWHGQSAEANPSGGNNYRGLYNIGLKSLGAAKKKHADVSLDGVLAYGERSVTLGRGYLMMDSPGNDLESIAGQVATGCNIIYFVTGNGSITNFPFVPTIKIVTTTARYELLKSDMDFNAGRYQEGVPMPVLGEELFELTARVASGELAIGERAGHAGLGAQVSIWRNWAQGGPRDAVDDEASVAALAAIAGEAQRVRSGEPLRVAPRASATPAAATAIVPCEVFPGGRIRPSVAAIDRVGLVFPTSLCSGEVARKVRPQQ